MRIQVSAIVGARPNFVKMAPILEEAGRLGLSAVFLQDGSYDDGVLDLVAKAPFKTVYGACIMVVTN